MVAPKKDLSYEKCLGALAALYDSKEKAEPGRGHREKAAAWRQKLIDFQTAVGRPDSAR